MTKPTNCNCGNADPEKFKYIGVQSIMSDDFYLNLYNCLKCRTSLSVKVDKRDQLPAPTQVHESIIMPDLYDLEGRN